MGNKFPPVNGKIPGFMHGGDYNPDQWLHDPEVLKEDIRLMKLARCNAMSVGIFAWSALEPEEGRFDFGWLDKILDDFAENGIFAWLATPSGARPAWMSQRYPEVLRVGPNRVRNLHGARHNHCYSSPVYREKTAILNGKLAERYANHPAVVGWHISNEYGGECHCDYCQDAFREWLKERYGSLDALNRAWWTSFWSHTYTDWSQVESPAPHGESAVHGMNLDWKRFVTARTVDFFRHEIRAVRSANPDLPVTANLMEGYEPLDYRKFADDMDVVSWDAYPKWHSASDDGDVAAWFSFNHDIFRSLKGGRPFLLMESTPSMTNWQPISKLKRPGMHLLSSLHAVAHGADSVMYFQWRKSRGSSEKLHGAVVDHAGHENTRVFRDVAELGSVLERISDVAGTTVPAEAAILFDWENWWAVKDSQGPRNAGVGYEETVMQHYRAFWEQGIPLDVVPSDADLSKYKLVVAPMMYMVSEDAGERIEKFVRDGGTFVATYWSGIVNENDLCHLGGFPGPLRRTLGIWSEEIDSLHDHDENAVSFADGRLSGVEGEYAVKELCDLIHSEGAETLAVYLDDFYAGRPAVTVNRLDAGRAYYIAARIKGRFHERFYRAVAREAGVAAVLDAELPDGVTAQVRTDGETDYVFLLNFSGKPQTVALDDRDYADVLADGSSAARTVELAVNGCRVLRRSSKRS